MCLNCTFCSALHRETIVFLTLSRHKIFSNKNIISSSGSPGNWTTCPIYIVHVKSQLSSYNHNLNIEVVLLEHFSSITIS